MMRSGDQNNRLVRYAAAVIVLFLAIRVALAWTMTGFESGDYIVHLSGWFEEIQGAGGLHALQQQVGNYGILYQFLIALMTYLPFSALVSYKLLSLAFDIVLALTCGYMVYDLFQGQAQNRRIVGFVIAYVAAILLPTAVLNSSLWAQCDSLYTVFALIAFLLLYKERDAWAFAVLGVAFSFKLQTAYILPVFLLIAFMRRHLHYIPLVLVGWYATCIPGFLAGRSLLSPLSIYLDQAERYPEMYVSYPSVWVLIGNSYEELGDTAIIYTVAILAAIMIYILYRCQNNAEELTPIRMLEIACLLTWTSLITLPCMHERYSYPLEMLLLVLVCVNHRYLPCLVMEVTIILMRYRAFLFNGPEITDAEAVIYLAAYVLFVVLVIRGWNHRTIRDDANAENA